eukprot:TRINITY_DN64522_c0_g1_i1.p1 TRINITY_DN64522_c0_g1~~TRINITY_DN64522_c0_g1_i1.p1  ORF type:complete len:732 (+),score=91.33 TRINITY_DN64522_c0_g1_i1:3-2198(+)
MQVGIFGDEMESTVPVHGTQSPMRMHPRSPPDSSSPSRALPPLRSVFAGLPGSPSYRGTFAEPDATTLLMTNNFVTSETRTSPSPHPMSPPRMDQPPPPAQNTQLPPPGAMPMPQNQLPMSPPMQHSMWQSTSNYMTPPRERMMAAGPATPPPPQQQLQRHPSPVVTQRPVPVAMQNVMSPQQATVPLAEQPRQPPTSPPAVSTAHLAAATSPHANPQGSSFMQSPPPHPQQYPRYSSPTTMTPPHHQAVISHGTLGGHVAHAPPVGHNQAVSHGPQNSAGFSGFRKQQPQGSVPMSTLEYRNTSPVPLRPPRGASPTHATMQQTQALPPAQNMDGNGNGHMVPNMAHHMQPQSPPGARQSPMRMHPSGPGSFPAGQQPQLGMGHGPAPGASQQTQNRNPSPLKNPQQAPPAKHAMIPSTPFDLQQAAQQVVQRSLQNMERDQEVQKHIDRDKLREKMTHQLMERIASSGSPDAFGEIMESIEFQTHHTEQMRQTIHDVSQTKEEGHFVTSTNLNEELHETEAVKRQLVSKTAELEQAKMRAQKLTRNLEYMQRELSEQRERERWEENEEASKLENEMDRLAGEEVKLRHHNLQRLRDRANTLTKARNELQEERAAVERARLEVYRNMERAEKELATKEADLDRLDAAHREEIEGVQYRKQMIEYYLSEYKSNNSRRLLRTLHESSPPPRGAGGSDTGSRGVPGSPRNAVPPPKALSMCSTSSDVLSTHSI